MSRTLTLLTVLFVLIGCGAPSQAEIDAAVQVALSATATAVAADTCGADKLDAYADAVEASIGDFEQQTRLVSTTPRVGLGTPLQRLLDLQTEARDLEVPECAEAFHAEVTSGMEMYQQAYQNFAAQGDEIMTQALLETGDTVFAYAREGIAELRAGKVPEPFKAPTATP